MIAPTLPLAAAGVKTASSVMVESMKILYRVTTDINEFIDDHIGKMKDAENPTVARTGRVLEMAKFGFGIGYITPVIVIATGQLILGNSMAAITTVATAATLTNPIAMTCAAVGAIYYGWSALTDQEKTETLEKLSNGFEIGSELIKSIIRFVTEKAKELLSKENLEEIKKYIGSAAKVFGKTLGDVTHKVSDMVVDTFDKVKKKTGEAVDKTGDVLSETYVVIKEKGEKAIDKMTSKKEDVTEKINSEPSGE